MERIRKLVEGVEGMMIRDRATVESKNQITAESGAVEGETAGVCTATDAINTVQTGTAIETTTPTVSESSANAPV